MRVLNEIAKRIGDAGSNVSELCREAEVARSTWDRWVSGRNSPTLATLEKVQDAADRIVDRYAAAAAAEGAEDVA